MSGKRGGTRSARWPDRRAALGILPRGSRGVEVGVWRGDFSAVVIEVVRPSEFLLIDSWRNLTGEGRAGTFSGTTDAEHQEFFNLVLGRFEVEIANGTVKVIRTTSLKAVADVRDGSLDWAYLDADHSFAAVLADLDAWWPKVRRGGHVLGHDWMDLPQNCMVRSAVSAFTRAMGRAVRLVGTTGEVRGVNGTPSFVLKKMRR